MIRIPQFKPWFDEIETYELVKYMQSGGYLTEHTKTEEFENALKDSLGVKNVIMVNNGTVSLWLILLALGIKSGDEVLIPNFSMIATANSVKITGATPVFCDIEFDTLCVDITHVKQKLTKKTKAVILVNANGRFPSYGIEELKSWCSLNNLYLIEDSAQGLGSTYPGGEFIGTQGIAGSFSLSVPKIITTGQGGFVATNDGDLANSIRTLKNFGRSSSGNDFHPNFGLNFKFTDLQAVVGLAQLSKLKLRVENKKRIWNRYKSKLLISSKLNLIQNDTRYTSPWFIEVLCENRDGLSKFLLDQGIGTRNMYPPMSRQLTYNLRVDTPNTFLIGDLGLWLPSYSQISDDEIDEVCHYVNKFYS